VSLGESVLMGKTILKFRKKFKPYYHPYLRKIFFTASALARARWKRIRDVHAGRGRFGAERPYWRFSNDWKGPGWQRMFYPAHVNADAVSLHDIELQRFDRRRDLYRRHY